MAQTTFEEISVAGFFYRNRDIAGFTNPSRAIFAAVSFQFPLLGIFPCIAEIDTQTNTETTMTLLLWTC